jgi:hypothetical protein
MGEMIPPWCRWQRNITSHTYELPPDALDSVEAQLSDDEEWLLVRARTVRYYALALPIEAVPTERVIPTQIWVRASVADRLGAVGADVRNAAREPVVLFRKHGREYVADGHHGLVAALMRGDPLFQGRMLDFGDT